MTAQPLAPPEAPATRFERLPIEAIEPHPRNVRVDVGDDAALAELADSIRAKGVLQPLLVAPLLGGARRIGGPVYVLIAGHRRRAAAVVAGLRELPCVIRVDLASEVDQLEAMLVENLQRTDLTVLEEGDAYQALLELGDDVKRISTKTGRAARTVKDRLAIAHLPEKVRGRVAGGQVTIEQAIALADFADTPSYDLLEQAAGTGNWPYYLRRAHEVREADRSATKVARAAKKAGITVLPGDTEVGHVKLARLGWAPGVNARRPGLSDEEHLTCPGHVLVEGRDWNGAREVVAACTQPDLHPEPVVEPDPEVLRAAAEREQLRADVETAAAVRTQHLAEVFRSRAEQVAVAALRGVVQEKLTHIGWVGREILRVVLDAGDGEDAAGLRNLRALVDRLPLHQLAVVLDVVTNERHEAGLKTPSGWPGGDHGSWWSDDSKGWRERLVDVYGYGWSDVEAGLLEPPAKADS